MGNGLKILGASVLGLLAGIVVGFIVSELIGVALLLGGGELPSWASSVRFVIVLFAAIGLVGGPMLVTRKGR
ncbi:hypothetical protein SAMN05421803_101399 [Nocardiopsis flavescens]|uniref:Major facilitator superfamily (MFS) profile domain-containing protein n=1 Tax=Nocardiopsis flavescens TaxID=758803 RepID=A0A1M6BLF6_9ACTN|nr:DUF5957 family protein [Nocardiopsis flavescens]SHI49506.1 hypothetical protein SAMN05421803_101399 [Nocardiopsis flavescens]